MSVKVFFKFAVHIVEIVKNDFCSTVNRNPVKLTSGGLDMCCSIKVMPVNFVCKNSLLSGIVSNDSPVKVSGVSSCQFALCGEGSSVVVVRHVHNCPAQPRRSVAVTVEPLTHVATLSLYIVNQL